MPELLEGQSVEIQGSASRPYVLKNVAGVYSCSCPAWRNQSLPIESRTCKHLRRHRGDAAEAMRIGSHLPTTVAKPTTVRFIPPLLLAETWDGTDPTGWWLSEKLDGVRAYWTGTEFVSRNGHRFHAPNWFTAGLPLEPLDGELWLGRKQFQRTVSIVRRHDESDLWKEIRFIVFDAPAHEGGFETRMDYLRTVMEVCQPAYAQAHLHRRCEGELDLLRQLDEIGDRGGEGLMLRQPESRYLPGRSPTLLKVKKFLDADARVIGHEPGAGRHKGRLGALLVEMANGVRFAVGSGLTDAERDQPPSIGSVISFRYQELSDRGVPRFPVFVRVRNEDFPSPTKGAEIMTTKTQTKVTRRFEFVSGSSDKFWEVSATGTEVRVCFGRNGTAGQTQMKSFDDDATAAKHVEKLIREKTGKGYVEI